MTVERTPPRPGRWVVGALLLVAAVLVVLSPTFGRATPTGAYRPPLPPDALTNGCYPLPGGVALGFPYQVRHDGDTGTDRRTLVVQYDELDPAQAFARLVDSFVRKGFTSTGSDPADVTFSRPGTGSVHASLVPLHVYASDQIVRGTITFDLPRIAAQSSAAVCNDVTSTKRFPSDQESHDVGVPGGIN